MFEFQQRGVKIEAFGKAIEKTDKEYRQQVATTWRSILRDAAAAGRALVAGLFGGRGKRIQRAFRYGVRVTQADVVARLGYTPTRSKGSFWWLGRIYEYGGMIRNRSQAGRLFEGGMRVSGRSRRGRELRRSGVTGSKKLWIPIASNRGADGAAIVNPSEFFASYQGRSVVKQGSGGFPVAYRREESGDLVPMFVLKDQIPIKQRPAVTPTASRFLPIIADRTGEALFSNFRGLA